MAINVWKVTVPGAVQVENEVQIATAAQTDFTLNDIEFVVGGALQVYINGVKQVRGVGESYIETSSTSIQFSEGLDAGDYVQFTNFT